MPHPYVFDTHSYVKKLKAVGFTEEQAEVQTEVVSVLIDEKLATKQDLKDLESCLKREVKELEVGLKRAIKEFEVGLKHAMKEFEIRLKHDLTIRMGAMLAATTAIIVGLVKLIGT